VYIETLEEYTSRVGLTEDNQQKINKLTKNIFIPRNIINKAFHARTRISGDEYKCGGITRNVKKYMIDSKIPRRLRTLFPIVCDDAGIVWVPGLGIADRLKGFDRLDALVMSLEIDK
jgi:tRNA(Ile)-lysidine synthase